MNAGGERVVSFFVPGVPVPQGNHTPFATRRGLRVRETSKGHTAWRAAVAVFARSAMGGRDPVDDAIELDVTFMLERPRSVARRLPTVPPDLSKLIRAVEDSLSKIVIADDARIVSLWARKLYAPPGQELGARITVRRVHEGDLCTA